MRIQRVSIVALLALSAGAAEPPRQGAPAAATADFRPVTVAVVDDKSGAPVTAFTYQAWYEAPGRKSPANGDVWTSVVSPAGTFPIPTPPSCRLSVEAKASDYVGGYPMVHDFVIKSADSPRRVVVRLHRGITVKGTVRDSRTKAPIAGATIAPVIHMLPIWVPDKDKQVTTGADGRYEVRGVDPSLGVSVSHPGYMDDPELPKSTRVGPNQEIFLKPMMTIAVKVVDPDGKPLEGVTGANLNGKQDTSGQDGRLVLLTPDLHYALSFQKDGFIDRKLAFEEMRRGLSKPEGIVMVMEPTIALTGRVVAPDGRPVTAFTIAAGPGKIPSGSDCVRRDIQARDGRFRLSLSKEGTTWVGVAAERFAAWEGWVEVKRVIEPLEIRLLPGVTVSARVVVSETLRNRVKASLVPRRDLWDIDGLSYSPLAEELPTRTATLSADGTLRFEHVRPDRYRLVIEGRGIPETVLAIDVPDAGLDAGVVRIDVPTAMGRVEGRVWHPNAKEEGVWAFADGYVGEPRLEDLGDDDRRLVRFKADENGRFQVDRVPVGLTTVGFPYQVFDVIETYTWSALVVEGQTTDVRAFDPEGRRWFTLAFEIGDGSKAQFESGSGLGASRKVDNVTVSSRLSSALEKKAVTPRGRCSGWS